MTGTDDPPLRGAGVAGEEQTQKSAPPRPVRDSDTPRPSAKLCRLVNIALRALGGVPERQRVGHFLTTAERWRRRAEELRAVAEGMTDPQARGAVLRMANGYERLAEHCEIGARNADSKRREG